MSYYCLILHIFKKLGIIDIVLIFIFLRMEKKQLIIAVLNKLSPYWNLAEGLLALMESQYLTNQTLD